MSVLQPAGQLAIAYEALRAQATGELPAVTPRGLALFLAEGLSAWMNTWRPLLVTEPTTPAAPRHQQRRVSPDSEIVRLLTEMAMGCQRGWVR
jgi:hypothetical protein